MINLNLDFWLVDPIRDEAVERKNEAEVELARCRIESMQVWRLWEDDNDDNDGDNNGGGDCESVMTIQWIGIFLVY